MCLIDSAEQIHKASAALMEATAHLASFQASLESARADGSEILCMNNVYCTEQEALMVLTQRVERAEASLKSLVYKKAAPADSADSQRVINQR